MRTLEELATALKELAGRGYRDYKKVEGAYRADRLVLHLDHAQGDPFADASRFRAVVAPEEARLPDWSVATATRRRASADFLNRRLHGELSARSLDLGSGKSGRLEVLRPGQQVLDRSSCRVGADGGVEARFRIGLPARGRRIRGRDAAELVTVRARDALEASLFFAELDQGELARHLDTVEDAVALREALEPAGLVGFVADGSILPRLSGIDDSPLDPEAAVPFESPGPLRVTLTAPNAGAVTGMGIPGGVTLIVGGGYHGKSTLLRALERGVYEHRPDDGRERVVMERTAVKVRAEDGRRVAGTDISNFIGGLPDGADTASFETENASGSTSQAAAIIEALEVGATTLLLDEDTSATNFMIRDGRMQRLIGDRDEPITPFIDRARQLYEERGVSTVLVVGGSGDYFDVADTVIAMRGYRPTEVTAEAREVARSLPSVRAREGGGLRPIGSRRPDPASLDPSRDHRPLSIRVLSRDRVQYGTGRVELSAVGQIVETAQTRAMAYAIAWAREEIMDGERTIPQVVAAVLDAIGRDGLEVVHPHRIGELAAFRGAELAAFLNRVRTLRTTPARDGA